MTPPNDSVPAGVRAIFAALRLEGAEPIAELPDADLAFADRSQLTPLLSRVALPESARAHVEAAVARNSIRVERVAQAYAEVEAAFAARGLDHVVLKGFTHVPEFVGEARLRVQYDLDLYLPPASREAALAALRELGYEPIEAMEKLAMDHLPTLIRKTGWKWRGDYFDPDFPTGIEIHFRFWDADTEHLRVEGLDDFWSGRAGHRLNRADALGYAALHLTRHLLRGNVRAFHVWEIANFLHTHDNAGFWQHWRSAHSRSLKQIEAIAFLLAKSWFACRVPDAAAVEIDALPAAVHRWFELYGWSPVETIFRPNKDELWLHTSLLESNLDCWDVLRRRLIPASLPGPIDAIHVPEEQMNVRRRVERWMRNAGYALSRAGYHARVLIPTLIEGLRWRLRSRS